jgi:hypothetical protein
MDLIARYRVRFDTDKSELLSVVIEHDKVASISSTDHGGGKRAAIS